MSLFDRRLFLLSAIAVGAGCGFSPTYQASSAGRKLIGGISLPGATDPNEFEYRERLRRRFGDAGDGATYRLESELTLTEDGIAITQASDITRFRVTGTAEWRLISIEDKRIVFEDKVSTFSGFDATDSAFAARSARRAAETRVVTELAELTASRLSAYFAEGAAS